MPLQTISKPPTGHIVQAVYWPQMDTGIKFRLVCRRCGSDFGSFGWDETLPGLVKLHSIVNGCNRFIKQVEEADEVCPGSHA